MKRIKDPVIRTAFKMSKLIKREEGWDVDDYESMLFVLIGIKLIKESPNMYKECLEALNNLDSSHD